MSAYANYDAKQGTKEPGIYMVDLPIIETPLTRLTEHWLSSQRSDCGELELDYVRCAAKVGGGRARSECYKYKQDYTECVWHKKTQQRLAIMSEERHRQKRPYLPAPEKDSVKTLV